MSATRLTIRIDFDDGRRVGQGKVRLLELIEEHGSISSAARAMKMSYRRAWLLADELNQMFEEPVVETQMGGRGGGNAKLSPLGQRLVTLYRSIETQARADFAAPLRAMERKLAP
jgi:molybdate transport system regulatory protein